MALIRLLPDGKLDQSFGHHGRTFPPAGKQSEFTAIAVCGGEVLLAGW